MKITKDADNLIIKVPLKQTRFNPYDDSEWQGENIIALIDKDCSFCYRVNMEYKGKEDQFTTPFLIWCEGDSYGVREKEKEEFKKLCEKI